MRAAWAIVAGLALGAGLAWWLAREAPDARRRPADAAPQDEVIYRWVDAEGVTQIGRDPPPDRRAQRVDIPSQRNIVPATPAADAAR